MRHSAASASNAVRAQLESGARALGLALPDAQLDALGQFMALLQQWSRVYNLTARRAAQDILTYHVLDSLAALPAVQRHMAQVPVHAILDVGSGGGLPGVVFAICGPQWRVDCVDAVGKKAAFIQHVAAHLRLPNLRGLHCRAEQIGEHYPLIVCRAFAALADFAACTRHALAADIKGSAWLALKGKRPQAEIAALPADVQVFHVEPVRVPGLDAQRCLVWMRRTPIRANT